MNWKRLLAPLLAVITASALWAAAAFEYPGDIVADSESANGPKLRSVSTTGSVYIYQQGGDSILGTSSAADETLFLDNEGAGGFNFQIGDGYFFGGDIASAAGRIGITDDPEFVGGAGSCLSRLIAGDYLYHDADCDNSKDAGDDRLDEDDDTPDSDGEVPDDITVTRTKCINVDPAHTTTDWLFFHTDTAMTVTGVNCIVDAATSVVMTLRECNSSGASCGDTEAAITCDSDGATEASSIDDANVDAGDWMRVTRGTMTGTPTQAELCVHYTSAS